MVDRLIGREGAYSNHPSDRGGETMWGMTIAVARRYGYRGAMRDMPRREAFRIASERFLIEPHITEALLDRPVVLIVGPRQAGKTTLVRQIAQQ